MFSDGFAARHLRVVVFLLPRIYNSPRGEPLTRAITWEQVAAALSVKTLATITAFQQAQS